MSLNILDASTTVAFTGYRPEKIKKSQPNNDLLFGEIQARLLGTIHKLADRGYKTFLSGMAEGFDLMAANAVLLVRNTFPEIELVCVVPFPEQAQRFEPFWKAESARVIKEAQMVITISEQYHSVVFHRRNDFLVDNASVMVCYYDGQPGGTRYTVQLAEKKQLEIINICKRL